MKIASLARTIEREHGTVNPFDICLLLGIVVQFHPLVELRGYYKQEGGRHFIVIADDLSPLAQLFVCAHELGHFLLHQRLNRVFMDSKTYVVPGRFENEADRFAAQLLWGMPPMEREPVTVWEMAEILNVPVCNVDARLIELGIYH